MVITLPKNAWFIYTVHPGKYCNFIIRIPGLLYIYIYGVVEFRQGSCKISNMRLSLVRFFYHIYIFDAP